jgi:hypothetical protein
LPAGLQGRLPAAALLVFFAWVGVCLLTPIANGDVWTNLAVGGDILAGGGFPATEKYSATAAGRPFVAYEWLSAVVFALVHQLAGAPGLILLRFAAGLACLGFVYFALEPKLRRHAAVLPLLVLASYLLFVRAQVRPHLFSLVLVSALCFALERWRRTRRWREILWLVPAHAIWANLHGAFLFGIVLLAAASGVVGLLALSARADGDEPYTMRDASQLGGVAIGGLLASLLNPYGAGVFEVAFRISETSRYISDTVWEWQSPLATGPGRFWFPFYGLDLALLWSCLLLRLRLREKRWLDFLIAFLVTFQSLRATRFVPYLAIFSVPIIARCLHDLTSPAWRAREERLRPRLSALLLVFMLATTVGPLSAYSPRHKRELGLGVSEKFPFEEVEFIKRLGLEGTIYNEYIDGGPLIYGLYPAVRPLMDSRIDVYGDALSREWDESRATPEAFFRYLRKYDANLVLLAKWWKGNDKIYKALRRNPYWKHVYESDDRALFVRSVRTPRTDRPPR